MSKVIKLVCDYCNNQFEVIEWQWRKNRKRSPNFVDIVCKRPECISIRKSKVYAVMVAKNKKSGYYQKNITLKRKGKKVEEFLGKEKGKQMREKVKQARLKQKDPRIGKKHTKKSKTLISKKHITWAKNHPETGKKHSKLMEKKWKNLSANQREEIRDKASDRILHRKWKNSCKTGYIKYWYNNLSAFYESSYEERYFNILNDKKKFWKKNTIIKIPYRHPIDNENHFYIPDVLVFKDRACKEIKEIIEIKPSIFLIDNGKLYNNICLAKKESLEKFCFLNNFESILITELDL